MYYQVVINIFELIAVCSGIFYLTKNREDLNSRFLIYYLVITFLIEIIFGWLPTLIKRIDYFKNLSDTIFSDNQWIYNIHDVLSISFFMLYFGLQLKLNNFKKVSLVIVPIFIFFSIYNLVNSSIFYTTIIVSNFLLGSILLFLVIGFYFYSLLVSEEILKFYNILPFYIAISCLFFYLLVTPIFIYDSYYSNSISPKFVKIHYMILTLANMVSYTLITTGFLVCSKKNKSYS